MWLQQHSTSNANIGSNVEEDVIASIGKFGRSTILIIGKAIVIVGDDAAAADAAAALLFPLTMTAVAAATLADSGGARGEP